MPPIASLQNARSEDGHWASLRSVAARADLLSGATDGQALQEAWAAAWKGLRDLRLGSLSGDLAEAQADPRSKEPLRAAEAVFMATAFGLAGDENWRWFCQTPEFLAHAAVRAPLLSGALLHGGGLGYHTPLQNSQSNQAFNRLLRLCQARLGTEEAVFALFPMVLQGWHRSLDMEGGIGAFLLSVPAGKRMDALMADALCERSGDAFALGWLLGMGAGNAPGATERALDRVVSAAGEEWPNAEHAHIRRLLAARPVDWSRCWALGSALRAGDWVAAQMLMEAGAPANLPASEKNRAEWASAGIGSDLARDEPLCGLLGGADFSLRNGAARKWMGKLLSMGADPRGVGGSQLPLRIALDGSDGELLFHFHKIGAISPADHALLEERAPFDDWAGTGSMELATELGLDPETNYVSYADWANRLTGILRAQFDAEAIQSAVRKASPEGGHSDEAEKSDQKSEPPRRAARSL